MVIVILVALFEGDVGCPEVFAVRTDVRSLRSLLWRLSGRKGDALLRDLRRRMEEDVE